MIPLSGRKKSTHNGWLVIIFGHRHDTKRGDSLQVRATKQHVRVRALHRAVHGRERLNKGKWTIQLFRRWKLIRRRKSAKAAGFSFTAHCIRRWQLVDTVQCRLYKLCIFFFLPLLIYFKLLIIRRGTGLRRRVPVGRVGYRYRGTGGPSQLRRGRGARPAAAAGAAARAFTTVPTDFLLYFKLVRRGTSLRRRVNVKMFPCEQGWLASPPSSLTTKYLLYPGVITPG
jgi:hypothetical protein